MDDIYIRANDNHLFHLKIIAECPLPFDAGQKSIVKINYRNRTKNRQNIFSRIQMALIEKSIKSPGLYSVTSLKTDENDYHTT